MNLLKITDQLMRVQKERTEKSVLKKTELRLFETKFNEETGNFDYALFTNKMDTKEETRILRLFRVKSVPDLIRTKQNNYQDFRSILTRFAKENISFVTFYAFKPGKSLALCYGILAEHTKGNLESTIEDSGIYLESLQNKFEAAYHNIEITPLTHLDNWVFDSFHYNHLTVARGIPRPDASSGIQTGSSPYSKPVSSDRQVSELLLKGATSKLGNNQSEGFPFLMYTVFDKLNGLETQNVLHRINNVLGMLTSSKALSVSEAENFSFPMMFGFGFDASLGENHAETMGLSEGHGTSESVTNTDGTGASQAVSNGHSTGSSEGTSEQTSVQEGSSNGNSENAGINFVGNFGGSETNTETNSTGQSEGSSYQESQQQSNSTTDQTSSSKSVATAHGDTNSTTTSNSQSSGNSSSQGHSNNIAAGISGGDSTGINRMQFDYFHQTAEEIYTLYRDRVMAALREEMFDYRMFILTPDKRSQVFIQELIKQSFVDQHSPLPVRVEALSKEEEQVLVRYARSMKKPETLERRAAIPEKYRFSTSITTNEATAFSLPQINLAGYNSSFDAVPQSIAFFGEMAPGARIGNQINPTTNMISPYFYNLTLESVKQHTLIAGATGQGKTYFNNRYISEIHNAFDANVLIFDWLKNYRTLPGSLKDKKKFRYNSFDPKMFPFKINLLRTPKGASDALWVAALAEILCYSMGLGDRSFRIVKKMMKKIKTEKTDPTMEDLVKEVKNEEKRRELAYKQNGDRMPFNEKQTFSSLHERLEEWTDVDHPIYQTMCKGPFNRLEDLIDGEFVHLFECEDLPQDARSFFMNAMTAAIFYYAKKGKHFAKPTFLFFEEAHVVLTPQTGDEPLKVGETIFETINREARNLNLFISYICQSPEKLPEIIIDNLPLRFIFQFPDKQGKEIIISAAGRDPQRLDVDLVKFISRLKRGHCLVRNSCFDNFVDGEFSLIKVSSTYVENISNEYFRKILAKPS